MILLSKKYTLKMNKEACTENVYFLEFQLVENRSKDEKKIIYQFNFLFRDACFAKNVSLKKPEHTHYTLVVYFSCLFVYCVCNVRLQCI